MSDKIQLFEDQPIRTAWDEEKEEWYFSVVDVCQVLAQVDNPRRYWSDLKRKLKDEGSELYEKIVQLKMKSPKDGKKYNTDVADTEQLLRIIQSIPSKKAELRQRIFQQERNRKHLLRVGKWQNEVEILQEMQEENWKRN